MNPQLEQFSDIELKAIVYDLSNQMQTAKQQIDIVNQELSERIKKANSKPPEEVVEEVKPLKKVK